MYIHFHKTSRVSAPRRGQSALHVAAAFGRLEVMKELLVRKTQHQNGHLKRGWFKNKVDEDPKSQCFTKKAGNCKKNMVWSFETMLGKVNWRFIRIFRLKLVHEKALRNLIHAFV